MLLGANASTTPFFVITRDGKGITPASFLITHRTGAPARIFFIKVSFVPFVTFPFESLSNAKFHSVVSTNHTIGCFSEVTFS